MATVEELAAKYGDPSKVVAPSKVTSPSINIDELAAKYSSDPDYSTLPGKLKNFPELAPVPTRKPTSIEAGQAGVARGLEDPPTAVGLGIGAIDEALTAGGGDRNRLFKKNVQRRENQYQSKFGDSDTASIGRTTGQVIATAPLVPSAAITRAAGALPVTLATGTKVAAPIANRLAATIGKGAVGGGEFGALTAQTNDKSLARNIGEGVITGAIGGPIVEGAGALAGKAVRGVEGLWANVNISKLARNAGLDPSAVKNIVGRLEEAGFTPAEAQLALNKLGPKATLADLDRSLTTELSGLATEGGRATTIAKNRMDLRGETANSDAVKIFENKFGPKPVLEAEKEAVHKQAQRLTAGDYQTAHASPQQLDLSTAVSDIDKALVNAVGNKASALKTVRGYLFKDVKDPTTGEVSKVLKSDIASLHEARQGIDDIINKRGDSLPPNALAAVKKVRSAVDDALKTNTQMQAADIKFSKHMEVKDALDFGYGAITKSNINKEEFKKAFDTLGGNDVAHKANLQEAVRKGMRAATGDIMEKSSQGELTGASRIFDKKAVNRANFKHAFGSDADVVLDELHRDLTFRNTERAVTQGSQTAERQAVQARYGQTRERPSAMGEGFKATALDFISGYPGVASGIHGAKAAVSNRLLTLSENARSRLIESSADILSRSGAERDVAVGIAERVKAIQDKTAKSTKSSVLRLPVSAASPIGEEAYEKGKNVVNGIRALMTRQ